MMKPRERLKQIIVLRKLQIKDIVAIFNSENTAELIQAFVNKLESLDTEIASLSELRRIVDDFLHKMLMAVSRKKMQNLFKPYNLIPAPGLRNCFYRREPNGDWVRISKGKGVVSYVISGNRWRSD